MQPRQSDPWADRTFAVVGFDANLQYVTGRADACGRDRFESRNSGGDPLVSRNSRSGKQIGSDLRVGERVKLKGEKINEKSGI
jgi:hypothetical protein